MLNRRKGEIATLLTLGLVILGGILVIGSSVFLSKNKQTTSTKATEPEYSDCVPDYVCQAMISNKYCVLGSCSSSLCGSGSNSFKCQKTSTSTSNTPTPSPSVTPIPQDVPLHWGSNQDNGECGSGGENYKFGSCYQGRRCVQCQHGKTWLLYNCFENDSTCTSSDQIYCPSGWPQTQCANGEHKCCNGIQCLPGNLVGGLPKTYKEMCTLPISKLCSNLSNSTCVAAAKCSAGSGYAIPQGGWSDCVTGNTCCSTSGVIAAPVSKACSGSCVAAANCSDGSRLATPLGGWTDCETGNTCCSTSGVIAAPASKACSGSCVAAANCSDGSSIAMPPDGWTDCGTGNTCCEKSGVIVDNQVTASACETVKCSIAKPGTIGEFAKRTFSSNNASLTKFYPDESKCTSDTSGTNPNVGSTSYEKDIITQICVSPAIAVNPSTNCTNQECADPNRGIFFSYKCASIPQEIGGVTQCSAFDFYKGKNCGILAKDSFNFDNVKQNFCNAPYVSLNAKREIRVTYTINQTGALDISNPIATFVITNNFGLGLFSRPITIGKTTFPISGVIKVQTGSNILYGYFIYTNLNYWGVSLPSSPTNVVNGEANISIDIKSN